VTVEPPPVRTTDVAHDQARRTGVARLDGGDRRGDELDRLDRPVGLGGVADPPQLPFGHRDRIDEQACVGDPSDRGPSASRSSRASESSDSRSAGSLPAADSPSAAPVPVAAELSGASVPGPFGSGKASAAGGASSMPAVTSRSGSRSREREMSAAFPPNASEPGRTRDMAASSWLPNHARLDWPALIPAAPACFSGTRSARVVRQCRLCRKGAARASKKQHPGSPHSISARRRGPRSRSHHDDTRPRAPSSRRRRRAPSPVALPSAPWLRAPRETALASRGRDTSS